MASFSSYAKLEREWLHFLRMQVPISCWDEARMKVKHYLGEGNSKKDEKGAADHCVLLGRGSMA